MNRLRLLGGIAVAVALAAAPVSQITTAAGAPHSGTPTIAKPDGKHSGPAITPDGGKHGGPAVTPDGGKHGAPAA